MRGLSSHFVLHIKILMVWLDVWDKPFWVGKPVSMLMKEIGGSL